VTVKNEQESLFGNTIFWYDTFTYWCWTRSTGVISGVSTGWRIRDVDGAWSWNGEVSVNKYFYQWRSGYTKSGYYHERTGHFSYAFKFSNNLYPTNILRSHRNGTWTWWTD